MLGPEHAAGVERECFHNEEMLFSHPFDHNENTGSTPTVVKVRDLCEKVGAAVVGGLL